MLIVGDVDCGRLNAVVQFAQFTAHQLPEFRIQCAQRLIHHERLRSPDHGAAECNPLPIAAGQCRRLARQQVFDAQEPRGLRHPLAYIAARHALALERKADVLLDIHVRIKREELKDEGDIARRRAPKGYVLAVEQNAPMGRQLEARDHPQRGGLATS